MESNKATDLLILAKMLSEKLGRLSVEKLRGKFRRLQEGRRTLDEGRFPATAQEIDRLGEDLAEHFDIPGRWF